MRAQPLALLALLLLAPGCGRGGEHEEADAPKAKAAVSAPVAGAEGEAMCAEHGVLEAVCTKCNPALIPVFQAKGDWCAEHELPESICPICHPERGGRPAVDVAGDESPADGIKVTLKTKETAKLAGIEVENATEGPAVSEALATARILYDPTRVAEVSARAPGIVRAIEVDVGRVVKRGAILARLESAGVGGDQSKLKAAASRVQVAEAAYERLKSLHDRGIAAEREVLEAMQEMDAARAEYESAKAALGVVGADPDGASRYSLSAPLGGTVTRRHVSVGKVVAPEEVLFEIVDTSTMIAEIDIPEADAPRAAAGQAVSILVDGLEGEEFQGKLESVAPEIDPHTRTVRGRVVLDNAAGRLRANMFGRARIALTSPRQAVLVPREAVQRARDVQLVFVRLADDLYEARRVQVLPSDGMQVAVNGRIAAGDQVVTAGSFFLKTETLKESIGAGCCEVD
jgi:cobalt-zinc-cadmium efflux system membrane fusion protein